MEGRDPVVLKAIRNVMGRQSSDAWWALPPRQKTEAIYAEIRRIDAEALERRIEERQPPAKRYVYAVV